MPTERQYVQVGCGILGASLALLLSENEDFEEIVALDKPDLNGLGPDTLRNSGILQSGLLFAERQRSLIPTMWAARQRLFRQAGLRLPASDNLGVVRTSRPAEIEQLALQLNLAKQGMEIGKLAPSEAKRLVGPFYDPKHAYFSTPDTTFNEDDLLRALIGRAQARPRVYLRESEVEFVRAPESPCGIIVRTDFEEMAPQRLVVCAGAGAATLLRQIGISVPNGEFQQAPLLVFDSDSPPPMDATVLGELYLDDGEHLMVARHVRRDSHCFVIGNHTCSNELVREVSEAQQQALMNAVPPELLNGAKPRYTSALHHRSVKHHIWGDPQFPNMVVGSPGRATLAKYAAESLRERLVNEMPALPNGRPLAAPPGGKPLDPRPLMHFELPFFDEGVYSSGR